MFLLIAFVLYIVVKVILQNKQYKQSIAAKLAAEEAAKQQKAPEVSEEILLLRQISQSLIALQSENKPKDE
jgi:large-conductance mechanosensitive channel